MPTSVQAIIAISEPSLADTGRFVVGQDPQGRWIAVEVHGRAGGLFRSRQAALHYAEGETGHRPDAVLLSVVPIELRL